MPAWRRLEVWKSAWSGGIIRCKMQTRRSGKWREVFAPVSLNSYVEIIIGCKTRLKRLQLGAKSQKMPGALSEMFIECFERDVHRVSGEEVKSCGRRQECLSVALLWAWWEIFAAFLRNAGFGLGFERNPYKRNVRAHSHQVAWVWTLWRLVSLHS